MLCYAFPYLGVGSAISVISQFARFYVKTCKLQFQFFGQIIHCPLKNPISRFSKQFVTYEQVLGRCVWFGIVWYDLIQFGLVILLNHCNL